VNLKKIAATIFRGWALFFTTTLTGLLIGGFLAVTKPNFYESTGTFLLRPGGENLSLNPGADPEVYQRLNLRANAEAILLSEELLRRVVNRIGPAKILAPYQPSDGPPRPGESWVSRLRRGIHRFQRWWNDPGDYVPNEQDALLHLQYNLLTIKPRRSDTITVSYAAYNPLLAQEILRVYMEEARKRHVEAYTDVDIQLVEKEHREAKTKMERAAFQLEKFLKDLEVLDFPSELSQARDVLSRARLEQTTIQNRIQTNQIILEKLQKRLQETERYQTLEEPMSMTRPRVMALQNRVNELEEDLARAKGRFQPGADEILQLEERLRATKDQLEAELAKGPIIRVQKRRRENPEWTAIQNRAYEIKLALEVDRQAVVQAGIEVKKAEARLTELADHKDRYLELDRLVRSTRADFEFEEQRLRLARKKSLAAQVGMSSLGVIAHANLPLEKSGPNRFKMLLGGIFGGAFFGLFFLLLRAVTDSTIRNPEDLEKLTKLKVLASIPKLTRRNLRRHQALRITTWS